MASSPTYSRVNRQPFLNCANLSRDFSILRALASLARLPRIRLGSFESPSTFQSYFELYMWRSSGSQ